MVKLFEIKKINEYIIILIWNFKQLMFYIEKELLFYISFFILFQIKIQKYWL